MGQGDTSPIFGPGDTIASVPHYLISQVVFVCWFHGIFFYHNTFYYNVVEEASASGGLSPLDPYQGSATRPRWGTSVPPLLPFPHYFRPPDSLPCPQRRQILAYDCRSLRCDWLCRILEMFWASALVPLGVCSSSLQRCLETLHGSVTKTFRNLP